MRYTLPLISLLFVGCASSEDTPTPQPAPTSSSLYVINQGSFYDGIDGSISAINVETGEVVADAFMAKNGVSLGGSPQTGVTYDNMLYVPAQESNRVWALNTEDLSIAGTITTNVPTAVSATSAHLFVANNDGFLSVYNRKDLSLTKHIAVGPNPCNMTISDGELFISISDGYNYPTYENGFRLARLSLTDLTLGDDIAVGMNPGQVLTATDGSLFLVCRGDYAATVSMVYKVDPRTGTSTYICDGSFIALQGEKLLVINAVTDWTTYETVNTYTAYDTHTGAVIRTDILNAPLPAMPIAIQCAPNGDIFVTSQLSLYDYTSPGILYHYDSEGQFKAQYSVGTSPCGIVAP